MGVVSMGLLSMTASKLYSETVRIDYLIEQETLAARAQKDGDLSKALVHYSNLVYATSSPGIRFFKSLQSNWSFLFPFAALFLEEMTQNADPAKTGQAKIEGINRGQLALVLETLGRKDEAEEQYQIAANLMLIKDIQRVKETARYIQEKTMQNMSQLEK